MILNLPGRALALVGDKGAALLILCFCCPRCELGEKASSLCKGASGRTAGFWQLRRFRGLLVLWEVCSCLGLGGLPRRKPRPHLQLFSKLSCARSWGQIGLMDRAASPGPCWQSKEAHLCPFHLRSALPEKPAPFQYPPGWPPLQELPPSLRAPPPGGWPVPPGLQWG